MHDKLAEALNEISEQHIAEAEAYPRRRRLPYRLGVLAAALALVIFASLPALYPSSKDQASFSNGAESPARNDHVMLPGSESNDYRVSLLSCLVAEPVYPEMAPYATEDEGWKSWWESRRAQYDQPEGYADNLEDYFKESIPVFLSSDAGNRVCSPLNVYMALAMLAEVTDGNSRAQILDLLDARSIESLRTQAGYVWNAHYCDDGATSTLLASSLWLDDALSYNQSVVDALANSYYASVFQGDLGSDEINQALRLWLNENTGGLLKEYASAEKFSPGTVLSLATTIYYRARWSSAFSEAWNTVSAFHGLNGDTDCTFMNQTLLPGSYYYGEDFGAVQLSLDDGSGMWLILPDEDSSVEELLQGGEALDMVLHSEDWERQKQLKVNLSVPKFDVSSGALLKEDLKELGITDVFDGQTADFSAMAPSGFDGNAYLSDVSHAARVTIDEEGVVAAAYTVMPIPGNSPLPEEEMDFVLDRPFLFIITSHDNLPLFAGTVYQP